MAHARYQFDLALAHPLGTLLLFLVFVALLVGCGGTLYFTFAHLQRHDHVSFSSALLDAGHFAADPAAIFDTDSLHGVGMALAAFACTVGGMVAFAILIGGVSEGIAEKHRQLKRGKNAIVEKNHWVILGWNDKVNSLVSQVAAAQSRPGEFTVVILSERGKEEMEEALNAHLRCKWQSHRSAGSGHTPLRRILCRSGSPFDATALENISIRTCRAVILLSTAEDFSTDAPTVKTVLALLAAMPRPRVGEDGAHAAAQGKTSFLQAASSSSSSAASSSPCSSIVVEALDPSNVTLLQSLDERITAVSPKQLIGRLMVQTSRQAGLSAIYSALLGFDGSEFYTHRFPELVGRRFDELADLFDDGAVVCGLLCPSERSDSRPFASMLNPPGEQIIQEGDQIVLLAENAHSYALRPVTITGTGSAPGSSVAACFTSKPVSSLDSTPLLRDSMQPSYQGSSSVASPCGAALCAAVAAGAGAAAVSSPSLSSAAALLCLPSWRECTKTRRHFLVIESRVDLDALLAHLNEFCNPGSSVTIYHDRPLTERRSRYSPIGKHTLPNLLVTHVQGSTVRHEELRDFLLQPRPTPFDSCLILCDTPAVMSLEDAKAADARTLMISLIVDSCFNHSLNTCRLNKLYSEHDWQLMQEEAAQQQARWAERTLSAASPTPAGAASASTASPATYFQSTGLLSDHAISRLAIVAEINDVRTKQLVQAYDPRVGEWVVSGELVAMALVQLAYDAAALQPLWTQLFMPGGQEICLLDARHFVNPGQAPISFRTLYALGRLRQEVVIGYMRNGRGDAGNNSVVADEGPHHPVLNPLDKGTRNIQLHAGDYVIVIAADHKGFQQKMKR